MATVVGQVLNHRYEILEKVGEGGMAIAYRGRDRVLGRVVAIKVMRPELAVDAGFVARFRREARAAAGITHEHIASVYDTGSDGPYHYIVMEYVEGESMRDRLRREGPMPLGEALQIATETAEALEAAHEAGVVHRDIKPGNILLTREGKVKVTDFGIARAASAPSQRDTSAILGSVSYVSPEQARGDATGPQADIYSLGATLFEALTGKPPFNGGDRLAVLHKHVYDRPPKPSELRPGLPPEVDSVVGHCLEKDLSRRFASAREVSSYLAACPRTEDTTAVARARGLVRAIGGGWIGAAGDWMQRRGVWVIVAALVLVGIVMGVTRYATARGRADMVKVPDLVGMGEAAAQELLGSLKLGYRAVGRKESDEMAEGSVLTQDPPPGVQVGPATVVKVLLSSGSSYALVPDVTQMSVAQAQRNLEAGGLSAGVVQEAYDEKVPAGYVMGTLPPAGQRVVRGMVVDIVLSLGPEPTVPMGPAVPQPPSSAGREETLNYVVPAEAAQRGEVEVRIDVTDEEGDRTIYKGQHRAGDRVPAQRIHISSPTTARIYVGGKLEATRQYLP